MCLENSRTRFCVEGEILLSELNKRFGWFRKEHPVF